MFHVCWKGKGEEFNSWEPEAAFAGCPQLLRDYWTSKKADEPDPEPRSVQTRFGRVSRIPARFGAFLCRLFVTE